VPVVFSDMSDPAGKVRPRQEVGAPRLRQKEKKGRIMKKVIGRPLYEPEHTMWPYVAVLVMAAVA